MRPEWFTVHDLPFRQMWQSDLYWYPLFLRGKLFTGKFEFDGEDRVIEREINVVETLSNE
jgi:hypothetical protein